MNQISLTTLHTYINMYTTGEKKIERKKEIISLN